MPHQCFAPYADGVNLEGKWPSDHLCNHRHMTLAEALAACAAAPECDGVTRDGGVECAVERSEYASTYPDGLAWRFPYSCRSKPTKNWPKGGGIGSWLKRGDCDEPLPTLSEQPACPVRTAMVAAAASPAAKASGGDDDSGEHHARRLGLSRAAELERQSAAEDSAIDAAQVARGARAAERAHETAPYAPAA